MYFSFEFYFLLPASLNSFLINKTESDSSSDDGSSTDNPQQINNNTAHRS